MRFRAICLTVCSLCFTQNNVFALEICGNLKQGELIVIKNPDTLAVNIENNLGKKSYQTTKEGITLVALHRDAPRKIIFDTVSGTDYVTRYEVEIEPTKWDIQRINGVAQSKVTPDKNATAEIKREQRDVGRALIHYTAD